MSPFQLLGYLSICLPTVLPQTSFADAYGSFSKHDELKAHMVVDVGDFERIDLPSGDIGATVVLTLNSNCFRPAGNLGMWGYGKKAGLVLVDRNKTIQIALIESNIGSIKIDTVTAVQIACPTPDLGGLSSDTQQILQDAKKQQEILRLQVERLRKQQK